MALAELTLLTDAADQPVTREVNYAQLGALSRSAAERLRLHGDIRAGDHVGLAVAEGIEMVVQQLGIWRCGAAFVPLDTALLPTQRLRYLIQDAHICAVVVARPDASRLRSLLGPLLPGVRVVEVDTIAAAELAASVTSFAEDPHNNGSCDDVTAVGRQISHLAYTSGSNGEPKGVVCEHRALLAYCAANAAAHGISAARRSRVLLAAAPSFDPSIGEAYTSILAGATLVLAPRAAITSQLGAVIRLGRATHVCTTPSLWGQLPPPSKAVPCTNYGNAEEGARV